MVSGRYVIIGAGAIGGTIGAQLADNGRDVVLVARGEHAAAIDADGLQLIAPDRRIRVRVPVVERAGSLELREDDTLVLATKSQHSAELLDAVAPLPVLDQAGGDVSSDRLRPERRRERAQRTAPVSSTSTVRASACRPCTSMPVPSTPSARRCVARSMWAVSRAASTTRPDGLPTT